MKIKKLTLIISILIISYLPLFLSISVWDTTKISGNNQVHSNLELTVTDNLNLTDTKLLLFLNGIPRNDGDTIKVEIDDVINVTVFFRDLENGTHIPNATVQLVGRANLSETNNQYYNITINTKDLEKGITILTIFAEKENYQPQSIQFFVIVVERESQLELFLDGVNMTLDPVIEVTIGTILNITVRFTDNQTGLHIPDALIQLIGEAIIVNFTENSNQYSINLNTTILMIGVKLFTIIAHAPDYSINNINLRITVNRIIGTINRDDGGSQIEVYAGEDVLLKIILKDPQNNTIKSATVVYNWAYGQGLIFDPENDGIYEADLVNVPSGTYIITITAFAGDHYDFESYEITLIVMVAKSLTIISPDASSSWEINSTQYIYWNSTGSMSNVRIELYNNGVFVMEIISSNPNNGEFYWFVSSELVESKNYRIKIIYVSDSSVFDYSDHFEIKHSHHFPQGTSLPTGIPGYDITLLLGIIGIIGVYLIRKKLIAKSI